jgi:hypothetical protein
MSDLEIELRHVADWLHDEVRNMTCDAGNFDGGSTASCDHCQKIAWANRIEALLTRPGPVWASGKEANMDMGAINAAITHIGTLENASGQICQMKDGKPHLLLFEFGCPNCSEVESRNADDMGDALATLVNAAPAYVALRAACEPIFDAIDDEMGFCDDDDAPAQWMIDAYMSLFELLDKAPPLEVDDPSGGDLPL